MQSILIATQTYRHMRETLPHKQKSAWKQFGSKKWHWRGMPTILSVNFWGEVLGGDRRPGETRPKNSLTNSLRNLRATFLKLAGPKRKCHPQIRSAEPRAQHLHLVQAEPIPSNQALYYISEIELENPTRRTRDVNVIALHPEKQIDSVSLKRKFPKRMLPKLEVETNTCNEISWRQFQRNPLM